MIFYEYAISRKKQLETLIKQLEKRLLTYPEGRICFQKQNDKIRTYQEIGQKRSGTRKRKYLNEDNRDVALLLAKKYSDELCLLDYKREFDAINAYIEKCSKGKRELDKIYDNWELFAPYLQKKDEITLTTEEQAFIKDAWVKNASYPEGLTVKVFDNLTVRSKSESIIAIALDKRKLTYRYECVTNILGHDIASDFTVFNRKLNRPVIWEHFGKMDDEKYREETRWKIEKYLRAGYIPNRDIIFTFETSDDPFTIDKAEKVLREFFD